MTDTSHRNAMTTASQYQDETSGWARWVVFGGVMLIMLGAFQIIEGLVALFDDGFYAVRPNGLVVHVDYTTWGWVHLLLGIVIAGAGLGVMVGQMWARVIGILLASLSVIVNIAFLAAYPVWSAIVIAIDVLVIYALTVHGKETKSESY
jgi:hypothetical protein